MEPEPEPLYTVFFKDREANYVNKLNPKKCIDIMQRSAIIKTNI